MAVSACLPLFVALLGFSLTVVSSRSMPGGGLHSHSLLGSASTRASAALRSTGRTLKDVTEININSAVVTSNTLSSPSPPPPFEWLQSPPPPPAIALYSPPPPTFNPVPVPTFTPSPSPPPPPKVTYTPTYTPTPTTTTTPAPANTNAGAGGACPWGGPNPALVPQFLDSYGQWVRMIHFEKGRWSVNALGQVIRIDDAVDRGTRFIIESVFGKSGEVLFGDLVSFRINDGSNRYIYMGTDGKLLVGCVPSSDVRAQFVVAIKHNGCKVPGCYGEPISQYEYNSHKILHAGNVKEVCGADVGEQINCLNGGSWREYELLVSG